MSANDQISRQPAGSPDGGKFAAKPGGAEADGGLETEPERPHNAPVPAFTETNAEQRKEIFRQIGTMNVMSISGGRVIPVDSGIVLPVSNGYSVRVRHTAADYYYVERVFQRGGVEWVKGARDEVDFTQVGEAAYRAGMFRSFDETEW